MSLIHKASPMIQPVALITGGARRVGAAVCLALARVGYDIVFTYHTSSSDAHKLVKTIRELGREACAIQVNLAKPKADQLIENQLRKSFARLDVLVNNASLYQRTPVGDITAKQIDEHLAINARLPLLLTQRLAPLLSAHADVRKPATLGRVINMVDMHVLGQHRKQYAAYAASKAALLELTYCLARELAPKVTVNAIAPGVVAWEESFTLKQRREYLKRVPLGRAGTPEDVATTVLYLVQQAHYVTGQVIRLDGGRLLT